MSRKSIVQNMRDIFENETAFKNNCDNERLQYTKNNQCEDQLNNKKENIKINNSEKCSIDQHLKQKAPPGTHTSHSNTLKGRIDKFNAEVTHNSSSAAVKYPLKDNSTIRRSIKYNEPVLGTAKCNLSSNRKVESKVGKLNLSALENTQDEFQKEVPSPKPHFRKNSLVTTQNIALTNFTEIKKESNTKKQLPVIPPKPKYINKIKPHPNMPPKTKNDLLAKIQLYNNLAADKKTENSKEVSQNFYDIIDNSSVKPKKKPKPPPKRVSKDNFYDIIENSPVKDRSNSEEYSVIECSNAETSKSLKPSPKIFLNAENNKECLQRNSEQNLYDIVENTNTKNTNINFRNILKSKSEKDVHSARKNFNLFKSNRTSSSSLDDVSSIMDGSNTSNEDENLCENTLTDDSSDDELATDYDVIENLNVTKITVERRYKVPDSKTDNSTFNVTRETYYDHNLNPRIERISRHVGKSDNNLKTCGAPCTKKSLLIIQELLQTELTYFKGLLRVYEDYIVYFKESPRIIENLEKIFGNFEEIYKRQIEFYGELTECNNDIDAIAETFLKNEHLFNLYEKYIINKHMSYKYLKGDCLMAIQARDRELGNKLNLDSYLLTPLQRLLRYRLLLKNLQEALEKENTPSSKLNDTVNFLENFIEGTNMHAKIVQQIENSPIDLSCRGKLLMTDDCFIRNNGKKYKSTVILFEDIIIFTRKTESDTYVYKNSINLRDLYIRSITEDLTTFQLQNFTEFRLKQDNKYVFDLEVLDPKIKLEWVKKIESLLWNQFAAHKFYKV